MSVAAKVGGNLPVDMSAKIGGRIVKPALPVVDSSAPSKLELSFDKNLQEYIKDNISMEPTEGIQRRERVLNRMGTLCRQWIRSVCVKNGLPNDVIESAGGQLFTSGSYRLGVHEKGADIDTILVAPNVCTRQDFFGTIVEEPEDNASASKPLRDPESLAERIRNHPDVTNFVPVEGAAVPILTFDWEGVNIDLLFARLNSASVSPDFDIDNDAVLDGVDSATEKSLNGPRVTNLIAALVSGTPQRYQTFLSVVRCVRKWAKARGLYSNKSGYWGGVNINIAVALCIQLYPTTPPASLLRKFFLVFRTWRWPNPVMLTKPHDAGYGLQVWSPQSHNNARQVAPIITPAYPAMNSTIAVSRQTLQIMHEEFCRGHEIMDKLLKKHEANPNSEDLLNWDELFQPSDFFIDFPYYLSLCLVGPTQADAQAWAGFVESRLRKLVSDMLGRSLPLSKIQLWPKKFEACIADRSALLTVAQRKNCITYFIGFQVDTLRMRGTQLNVEAQLAHFREWELARFQPLVPGMDILAKSFTVKNLPKICFEMYEGGKEGAMKRRRAKLDADPKRQEKKRLRKLNELKAKMAEIQRRKEQESRKNEQQQKEQQQKEEAEKGEGEKGGDAEATNASKRKRSDSDVENNGESNNNDNDGEEERRIKAVKIEEENLSAKVENKDETNNEIGADEAALLESALDTLQDTATGEAKTREEAEADRRKLMSGELLVEGAADDASDDEELGYAGDEARQTFRIKPKKMDSIIHKDKRAIPMSQEQVEVLRKLGHFIVSDAEQEEKIVGGNMPPPFRRFNPNKGNKPKPITKIDFRTKFNVIELDVNGFVIDKGDDDFTPSSGWKGRKAGFEFKLGARGLGYYRTGKKVVVPSNTHY